MKRIMAAFAVCIMFSGLAYAVEFNLDTPQIIKDIEAHYNEVLNKPIPKIYLLDIIRSEEDRDYIYVFFLKDKVPELAKDIYNNVYSEHKAVMVASYTYSYLHKTWKLENIKKAEKGFHFKVQ